MNRQLSLFCKLIAVGLLTCTFSCATGKDKAKQQLEEIKNSEWHYKMATGYFESHQIPNAIQELALSLQKDPKNPDAHYLLGFIYQGRQEYDKALSHFDAAAKGRQNFYSAINGRGSALLALGRWEAAIKDFEWLTEQTLYTTPELAYNNLGWAEYNLGQYASALQHFQRSTFLQPQFCVGYNNTGLAFEALNQLSPAIDAFLKAIEKCGDVYAEPHFHLGKIYASQGDPRAIDEFQKCNDINRDAALAGRCREYARAIGVELQ